MLELGAFWVGLGVLKERLLLLDLLEKLRVVLLKLELLLVLLLEFKVKFNFKLLFLLGEKLLVLEVLLLEEQLLLCMEGGKEREGLRGRGRGRGMGRGMEGGSRGGRGRGRGVMVREVGCGDFEDNFEQLLLMLRGGGRGREVR